MFAAALPQPAHNMPGGLLATGIRDALTASSFRAHMAGPATGDTFPGKRGGESHLPVHLLPQANALCAILGVPSFPLVKVRVRPSLSIADDALARIRVADLDETSWFPGVKGDIIVGRRQRRRAKAWARAG